MNRSLYLLFLLIAFGCSRVSDRIDPRVSYQIQDRHFARLQSAFAKLSERERSTDWGKEMLIAIAFAQELDLYRAVSTFKRAEILIPLNEMMRKLEIQYDILLCYYLGNRYDEAIESFDKSELANADKSFPAYHDLLLVLYECYREMESPDKEERMCESIDSTYPATAEGLKVSRALRGGELACICDINQDLQHPSYLDPMLTCYDQESKSVGKAQMLNAILPGAGYLYIGQKKSAATAFLLNGLFIAAAYQFFYCGHVAAGVITTGFEAGWYFGGIYGAGEEAKYYNERLYECNAGRVLNERSLFPVLMLQHAF
jgi:tetratricopeptide (TPR) repeat protein